MTSDRDTGIPTNLRLLIVIEEIARTGTPVTPTEVNAVLGLPKQTIHRLFATLEDEGFLQRDLDGRTYSPGHRLRVMAGGVMSSLRIRTARQTILKRLSQSIGETCNIVLPDRDAMTYIERVETEWPLRIQLPIGARVPFYCTASGKMYLSALSDRHLKQYAAAADLAPRTTNTHANPDALIAEVMQIRAQGYAIDNEEFMENMVALATPIHDANGRLMSCLAFHAPTQRLGADKVLDHLEDLRRAAEDLSALIETPLLMK